MSKKNWKDHLLSSGVPLEHSILTIVEDLGFIDPREFKYERNNPEGVRTCFSIDVYAPKIDSLRNIWLELFIECKYRHDNTKWVFAPYEDRTDYLFETDPNDVFILLDQYYIHKQFNASRISKYCDKLLLCRKAVEILPNSFNRKSIEQAIQQLRFSLPSKIIDCLVHQVQNMLGSPTPTFALIPIVVTTAELWRLNSEANIDDIRTAAELDDIAKNVDVLLYYEKPDNLAQEFTLDLFYEKFLQSQINEFEVNLKQTQNQTFQFFSSYFSKEFPSLFMVINYKAFKKEIAEISNLFKQKSIQIPRDSNETIS